jgi:hypothetical protein
VVARFINRIGTAVPAFDVHDAFVEYAGSLLTANEPCCSSISCCIPSISTRFYNRTRNGLWSGTCRGKHDL